MKIRWEENGSAITVVYGPSVAMLDGITNSMDMSLSKLQELVMDDGQRGLAYCDSWGHKESDMTEWLNWIELGKPGMLQSMGLQRVEHNWVTEPNQTDGPSEGHNTKPDVYISGIKIS